MKRLLAIYCLLLLTGCGSQQEDYRAAMALLLSAEPARAAQLLEPLARAGDAQAQFRLGVLHLKGKGVELDLVRARMWLERSAQADDLGGQFTLARSLRTGELAADPQTARIWFERAGARGFAPAELALAEMLERGEGGVADSAAALEWYRRAASHHHAAAISRLAQAYERGELGVPPDAEKARSLRESLLYRAF